MPDLIVKLRRLRQLVDGSSNSRLLPRIDDEIQKLQADRFHLVVLGQFKRGKTTFINALLGEELLPVGVIPVTSVVTIIRHGSEKRYEVVFSDNHRIPIQREELRDYVTEQGNAENRKRARYVEITHPSRFLEHGLLLIDTPGIGSLDLSNTETTQGFIPNVDAAVIVLSGDLPITRTEHHFLGEVATQVEKLFFVMNKMDLLAPSEAQEAISYAREALGQMLKGNHVDIIPLSARNALLGEIAGNRLMVEESNLGTFEQTIETFVRGERTTVLEKRSLDRANRLITEALFAVELELNAIMTPVTGLQAKINEFRKEIALLKREREDFGFLLQGQIGALIRWIEGQLGGFGSSEIKRLTEALSTWAEQHPGSSGMEIPKAIQSHLASKLVADFDLWRTEQDAVIARKYDAITSTYAVKTNEFIRRIFQLSSGLFHMDIYPFETPHPVAWKQTFSYRTENDPVFLEFDALKVASVLLPDRAVRKWILGRVRSDVPNKVTRNCGRLRYEYEYSIQESYRTFQCDLNEKIDGVINQIHDTLTTAMEMLGKEKTILEARLLDLQSRVSRLRQLQSEGQVSQ